MTMLAYFASYLESVVVNVRLRLRCRVIKSLFGCADPPLYNWALHIITIIIVITLLLVFIYMYLHLPYMQCIHLFLYCLSLRKAEKDIKTNNKPKENMKQGESRCTADCKEKKMAWQFSCLASPTSSWRFCLYATTIPMRLVCNAVRKVPCFLGR